MVWSERPAERQPSMDRWMSLALPGGTVTQSSMIFTTNTSHASTAFSNFTSHPSWLRRADIFYPHR
jgi:hypothetical protein